MTIKKSENLTKAILFIKTSFIRDFLAAILKSLDHSREYCHIQTKQKSSITDLLTQLRDLQIVVVRS